LNQKKKAHNEQTNTTGPGQTAARGQRSIAMPNSRRKLWTHAWALAAEAIATVVVLAFLTRRMRKPLRRVFSSAPPVMSGAKFAGTAESAAFSITDSVLHQLRKTILQAVRARLNEDLDRHCT